MNGLKSVAVSAPRQKKKSRQATSHTGICALGL